MAKRDLYYNNPAKKKKTKKKKATRPRLLSEEIHSTYNLLVWTIVIMILVLSLSYLYVSSQKAAKGYLLRELQLDYESLTSESKELETQLIDAQSLQLIDTEATEMTEPTDEEFTFIENGSAYAKN